MTPAVRRLLARGGAVAAIAVLVGTAAVCRADDKAVAISAQLDGDQITLTAKLTDALDVTMSLSLDLENLAPSAPLPLIVDSDGRTDFQLLTLKVIDKKKPYKYGYRLAWKPGGRQKSQPKAYAYALPYKDGPHKVRQGYLGRFSHYNGSQDEYAIDWAMPVGTPVCAARDGIVAATRADATEGGPNSAFKKDYNYIVIRHEDGTYAEYLHLDTNGIKVHAGDKIKQGEVIGLSGNTGYTSEPHLHFAVFNTLTGIERKTIPVEFSMPSGKHFTPQVGKSY